MSVVEVRIGCDALDDTIENAGTDWWFSGATMAIRQLALSSSRGFTAENVIDLVGRPDVPSYLGAVFAAAQKRNLIEPVGCRVAADGRLVRIWWGKGGG